MEELKSENSINDKPVSDTGNPDFVKSGDRFWIDEIVTPERSADYIAELKKAHPYRDSKNPINKNEPTNPDNLKQNG